MPGAGDSGTGHYLSDNQQQSSFLPIGSSHEVHHFFEIFRFFSNLSDAFSVIAMKPLRKGGKSSTIKKCKKMSDNDVIISLGICVLLPVIIILIIGLVRKHEVDRRTEIMLKAIEAGVPIDTDLFKTNKKGTKKRTIKQDLLDRLTGACVTSFMGAAFLASGIFSGYSGGIMFLSPTMMTVTGSILLAIGIALLIVYFISKNMLKKEIEAEEKELLEK